MGGFKYVPSFSREFISKERKDVLIDNHEAFEITKVRKGESEFGPQFYLAVAFENGETGTMTFGAKPDDEEGSVPSRNDLLSQLATFLSENPDESVIAYLVKKGQTKLIQLEDQPETGD